MKRGLMSDSDVMIYLESKGITFNPYKFSFNEFIKSLNLYRVEYNKIPCFQKSLVEKRIKELKQEK